MTGPRGLRFGRFDCAAFVSFFTYASGSVVVPVALVALARDLGFSLEEGGMAAGGALHLGRTVPMVAAMLLCGFAAGRWGKRRTFGWAVLLMGAGIGLCAVAPGYGLLLLALSVAGIGEGFIEGLATPFVQDLHPEEPGRYINFAHAFWPIGVLTTVLLSGALLSAGVSWRLILGAVGALALVPGAMLLLPVGGARQYPEHPEPIHWRTVWGQASSIVRIPRFWLFYAAMFLAGGGEFCLTFWCASHIQLSFSASAWAGGVGTACFAAGMMLGRTGWGYLIKQHQLRALIVLSAVAGTAIGLVLPSVTHLWVLFGVLFAAGLATAPFWPSVQSYTADRLPEVDTTMLFVLLSCAGVPGCGVFTWLMGVVANRTGGLGAALYLVPACFALLGVLIAYDGVCARRGQARVAVPVASA
jgi:MFS family permease